MRVQGDHRHAVGVLSPVSVERIAVAVRGRERKARLQSGHSIKRPPSQQGLCHRTGIGSKPLSPSIRNLERVSGCPDHGLVQVRYAIACPDIVRVDRLRTTIAELMIQSLLPSELPVKAVAIRYTLQPLR